MKFGKHLAKRQLDLPEYANYFINYKALKKLIKQLSVANRVPIGTPGHDIERALQENKATFFFQLERELEKVNTFYLQKEAELKVRIDILCEKKISAYKAGGLTSKSSVLYISLYEGFLRFRRDLERLEQFIELNGTGFSKVLKKWDKRSKSHTKELYLSRAVEIQPVFHREELGNFSDLASSSLIELEAWTDGDHVSFDAAMQEQPAAVAAYGISADAGHVSLRESDDLYSEFVKTASLYDASDKGSVEAMQKWIEQLLKTDDARERITRIFLLAVPSEATDAALLALYGTGFVDIHATDEISGKSCLHRASARSDRRSIINLAISQNVDVTIVDVYGKTALHYACIANRHDLIPLYLKHGANIDAIDNDNFSPLLYSIVHGFARCVEDLVSAGARLDVESEKDYIPLNLACQYGHYDIVRAILDKNPNFIFADAEGLYPIHVVARAGHHKLVALLKSYNINLDELDKLNQWTALFYAASEGHYRAVKALLDSGADPEVHDEYGYSALYHAAWEGRTRCVYELRQHLPLPNDGSKPFDTSRPTQFGQDPSQANNDSIEESLNEMDLSESGDLDGIPDLSLPPPIIPLQRYGHNFLDNKKIILQLLFDSALKPIHFHREESALPAGRLTISTRNNSDFIPRSIILPISDTDRVVTFQVDSLDTFAIDFEVFSTFGTRVIAKTSLLPYVFQEQAGHGSEHHCRLPLFDVRLRSVGDISFHFQIVKPFRGKPLEITKYDTYWKSTSQVEQTKHQVQAMSFVTASSLSGEYGQVSVCLTRDLKPVVASGWSVDISGVEIPIGNITQEQLFGLDTEGPLDDLYDQLRALTDVRQLRSVISGRRVPLDKLLKYLPVDIKLSITVLYPTSLEASLSNFGLSSFAELNIYVDHILSVIFEHAREMRKIHTDPKTGACTCRSLLFSSASPDVCAVLNWKQPNYPVFFWMKSTDIHGNYRSAHGQEIANSDDDRRCISFKDAANFATNNNLLGIICNSDMLTLVPSLVPSVRVLGLVLVSHSAGDSFAQNPEHGVDGLGSDEVLLFKQTIDM